MQEAEKVDGGYLCSGLWQFASGCRGADILGIGLAGGPDTDGMPLTALVDPADVEIVENWDVAGMRPPAPTRSAQTDSSCPRR